MSCGNPHGTPCEEVLGHLYEFLDGELAPPDQGAIRQHLDECGPCLREYGLEEAVKSLVSRCCKSEQAPADLHQRVLQRIAEVRAQMVHVEPIPAQASPPSDQATVMSSDADAGA